MAQGLHLIIQITLKVINFYGKFIEFFQRIKLLFWMAVFAIFKKIVFGLGLDFLIGLL